MTQYPRGYVQNVYLLPQYRPHIGVPWPCEDAPKFLACFVVSHKLLQFYYGEWPHLPPGTNTSVHLNDSTSRKPKAWPPCSPDLSPLNFYLYGHLKALVYSSPMADLATLHNRNVVGDETKRNISTIWMRFRGVMEHRRAACIE